MKPLKGTWDSRLSVFYNIRKKFDEQYNGEDDSTLFSDLYNELTEHDRLLCSEEAGFFCEALPNYASAEDPLEAIEPLIMEKFESQAA